MGDFLKSNFPDDYASNEEKASYEYGNKAAEAVRGQWYNGQLGARRYWITLMRQYGRGEQSTLPYKKTIEGERKGKDDSVQAKTHKIDYTQLKVMPVFKDIIANSIDESLFVPRAEAIDQTAVNEKKDYFKKMENDFLTQDIARIISQGIGVDITPKNLPKDATDLNKRKIEYKPKIEIAQELSIQNVFKSERFEAIKDKIDEDLIDLGLGVGRHYTDYSEGIRLKYVDPYNYIHSPFEIDDGRDIRYHGVECEGTISEIIKESACTDERIIATLKENLKKLENKANSTAPATDDNVHKYFVFAYNVSESKIYKKLRKNKTVKLIDRSEKGYEPQNDSKRLNIPFDTWYEGIYVPEAELLMKWEKIENQVEDGVGKPIPPFIVYAPKVKRLSELGTTRFDSMTERAIPIIDDIHRDWYKFQQLKMELRPNTVTISPRALENVMLNGKRQDPNMLIDLYFGRGLLLAEEFDDDGERIGKAITEEGGGYTNSAIGFLSQEFTNNYNRLRQLLGINELRDGTTQPNTRTAVTVQKLLLASSNNATNHIVKASFNISLRFAESVSMRLHDVLNTKSLHDRYMNIIGSDNVDLLDEIAKIPMYTFGIYFDFRPDSQERVAFEQSLVNDLNAGKINSAQYNKARQIRNVKRAVEYLEIIIGENEERDQKFKIEATRAQSEAQAQSSVLSEQSRQQTVTIEFETKKNLLYIEADIQEKRLRTTSMIDELKAIEKHKRDMELETIKMGSKQQVEGMKEDRKDERVNLTKTNESEIAYQRQNNTAPIDFKNRLQDIFKDNPTLTNR